MTHTDVYSEIVEQATCPDCGSNNTCSHYATELEVSRYCLACDRNIPFVIKVNDWLAREEK